jgi:DNA-binding MarR family transcriptional regulator
MAAVSTGFESASPPRCLLVFFLVKIANSECLAGENTTAGKHPRKLKFDMSFQVLPACVVSRQAKLVALIRQKLLGKCNFNKLQNPAPPVIKDNARDSLYIYNIVLAKAMKRADKRGQTIEEVLNSFGEIMAKLMIDHHQKQVEKLDLTLLQGQLLRVLRRGPMPTGKLAAELRVSASAVTQLTDRLIRKGLIEREPAASDRRSVIIRLSAKGLRVIEEFRKRRGVFFKEAIAQLNETEQAHVIEAMRTVIGALEGYQKTSPQSGSRTAQK